MEDNGSQLKKLKRDNGSTDESGLKKTTTSDKATQTNSLSILLRRDPTDDASTPTNSLGLTITTSALNNPDLLYPNSKRLLRRYLASTQQLPPAHITESFPSTPVPPSLESNETSQFSNIASKILGRLVPATLPPPVITEPKRRTNSFGNHLNWELTVLSEVVLIFLEQEAFHKLLPVPAVYSPEAHP